MRAEHNEWMLADKYSFKTPGMDAVTEAYKKKDYKRFVELAETVFDYEFTNRSLHLAAEDAYRKLSNKGKADFHHGVAEKLLQALFGAGDGRSVETAYCVLSIDEEYLIMRELGYTVLSQAFITASESNYDMLSGRHKKTGKRAKVYFDISGYYSRCVENLKKRQK